MFKTKEWRIKKGLTQSQMAKILNMTHSGYNQLENEKYIMNALTLIKLSLIFECFIDDLINLNEIKSIYELNKETYQRILKGNK